jgi:hypothetical protein
MKKIKLGLRKLSSDNNGSVIPVLCYLAGFFVFGTVKLFMNDIVDVSRNAYYMINETGLQVYTANTYDWGGAIWTGIVIAYIIGGIWWLLRMYGEQKINLGG